MTESELNNELEFTAKVRALNSNKPNPTLGIVIDKDDREYLNLRKGDFVQISLKVKKRRGGKRL